MELEKVLSNVEAIRSYLARLPKRVEPIEEDNLLFYTAQINVCHDYLVDFLLPAERKKEKLSDAHKLYVNKRTMELMEENPSKWKTKAKCEAQAESEEEYEAIIEERAEAIAHAIFIKKKIDSVKGMDNAISRLLNSINTDKRNHG